MPGLEQTEVFRGQKPVEAVDGQLSTNYYYNRHKAGRAVGGFWTVPGGKEFRHEKKGTTNSGRTSYGGGAHGDGSTGGIRGGDSSGADNRGSDWAGSGGNGFRMTDNTAVKKQQNKR